METDGAGACPVADSHTPRKVCCPAGGHEPSRWVDQSFPRNQRATTERDISSKQKLAICTTRHPCHVRLGFNSRAHARGRAVLSRACGPETEEPPSGHRAFACNASPLSLLSMLCHCSNLILGFLTRRVTCRTGAGRLVRRSSKSPERKKFGEYNQKRNIRIHDAFPCNSKDHHACKFQVHFLRRQTHRIFDRSAGSTIQRLQNPRQLDASQVPMGETKKCDKKKKLKRRRTSRSEEQGQSPLARL